MKITATLTGAVCFVLSIAILGFSMQQLLFSLLLAILGQLLIMWGTGYVS